MQIRILHHFKFNKLFGVLFRYLLPVNQRVLVPVLHIMAAAAIKAVVVQLRRKRNDSTLEQTKLPACLVMESGIATDSSCKFINRF
jgi:hypothetical protein